MGDAKLRCKRENNLKTLSSAHIEADQWAQSHDLLLLGILPFVSTLHRVFGENLPLSEVMLQNGEMIKPGVFSGEGWIIQAL